MLLLNGATYFVTNNGARIYTKQYLPMGLARIGCWIENNELAAGHGSVQLGRKNNVSNCWVKAFVFAVYLLFIFDTWQTGRAFGKVTLSFLPLTIKTINHTRKPCLVEVLYPFSLLTISQSSLVVNPSKNIERMRGNCWAHWGPILHDRARCVYMRESSLSLIYERTDIYWKPSPRLVDLGMSCKSKGKMERNGRSDEFDKSNKEWSQLRARLFRVSNFEISPVSLFAESEAREFPLRDFRDPISRYWWPDLLAAFRCI